MSKQKLLLIFLVIAVVAGAWFLPLPSLAQDGKVVEINLIARQFEYTPGVIHVQKGDHVRINLTAEDVTHGFYLDGYGVTMEALPHAKQPSSLEFVADKTGKFNFRCATTCGPFHPFMIGELIVDPNSTFPVGIGLTLFFGAGTLLFLWRRKDDPNAQSKVEKKIDLTAKWPWLRKLLLKRWLQPVIMIFMFIMFIIIIFAGIFGTQVGNANFAIIFVWIVWFVALIVLLIPLGGRAWCMICPLPAPGEWIDHRSFITKGRERDRSIAVKGWPKSFKNIWLQNISFLGVGLFSGIIMTRPLVTSIVLSAFIIAAIIFSLKYGRRIFCRYVCPVGGFIGLYSLVAPLEIRVKDKMVCRQHRGKECSTGCDNGYGCPWMELPWNMDRNAYCGMCTECLKTCPMDNVSLNVRPFGSDLFITKGRGLDEAYKAFIMLTSAAVYSVIFLGHWGILKDAASIKNLLWFLIYALCFLIIQMAIVPGLFYTAVWIGRAWGEGERPKARDLFAPARVVINYILRRKTTQPDVAETPASWEEESPGKLLPLKLLFIDFAYVLVPMGLAGWIAFCFSFGLINISYAFHVLNDPFGWGWNLFGLSKLVWTPYLAQWIPYIQAPILLFGLVISIRVGYRIIRDRGISHEKAWRSLVPVAMFLTLIVSIFMWIYL